MDPKLAEKIRKSARETKFFIDNCNETRVLKDFLSGTTTAKAAAEDFTSVIRNMKDLDERIQDKSSLLFRHWVSILYAAEEIPSPQDKIMEFLTAIKNLDDLESRVAVIRWRDLPFFGDIFNKVWAAQAVLIEPAWYDRDPLPEIKADHQKYINLNAFGARLTASGTSDLKLTGLMSLCVALEDECWIHPPNLPVNGAKQGKQEVPYPIQCLNAIIPLAAPWLLIAGKTFFECEEEWEINSEDGHKAIGGKLWKGKPGFCKERWALWKERLGLIGDMDELADETRKTAIEVLKRMTEIEG